MRERLVIANWKMNPATIADALALAEAVARRAHRDVVVGVAPPAIALTAVAKALAGTAVVLYAQDVHWEERGAYTGQTSVTMLRGVAAGSIVGHSEVRRDQGDDDRRVAKKVVRVLSADLRVVLCVGESENEFAAGETEDVLDRQIRAVIRPVKVARETEGLGEVLVIAYEPIWAIGTGRPATGAHATRAAAKIRNVLRDEGVAGETIAILYGGSVSPAGAREFARADGIDGALVGGASLKAEEFAAIVDTFA